MSWMGAPHTARRPYIDVLFNAFRNFDSSVSVGVAAATQTSERFSPRQRSWRCPSCTFLGLWKIIAAVYEREGPRRTTQKKTSSRTFDSLKFCFFSFSNFCQSSAGDTGPRLRLGSHSLFKETAGCKKKERMLQTLLTKHL